MEQARDVVQDTFLRLCSQKPSRVRDHVAQWLFTVCRNRALDLLRKEKRMNFNSEVELEAQPASQPAVSTILEQKEQVGEILRLLETLPSNQQEVICLRFQNEFSYREISAVTDLSVSNVGFLIHTGLKTIRRKLNALSRSRHTFMRRVK
jgi:RNA polymerase sigma-70 factor (ECF subfamily)